MKVVLINKSDSKGGASIAAVRLNDALRIAQVESSLLVEFKKKSNDRATSLTPNFLSKQKAFLRFVGERIFFLRYEKDKKNRYAFSPANTGIDISNHPIVKEADIIHLHWTNQGFLSLSDINKLLHLGKPVVWTLHDMWAFTGGCHYSGACYEFVEKCGFCPYLNNPSKTDLSSILHDKKKTIYKNAKLTIVTCSRWLSSLAKESTLLRSLPVYAIPNPINTEFYAPRDRQKSRLKLGIDVNKKVLLFGAANVQDERKGINYLIKALETLHKSFPVDNSTVEVVVFGKAKQDISARFPFNVKIINYISNPSMLVDLYNAADVFILPSLQDNLPNTVMESLSCGTPVVAFNIGGVPEMITHEQTGFLAEPRNSLSLAKGIYNIVFTDNYPNIRENARNKVLECFSEEVVANRYYEIYKNALKSF